MTSLRSRGHGTTSPRCRHALITGLMGVPAAGGPTVGRCRTHSRDDAGVSVWAWGAGPCPDGTVDPSPLGTGGGDARHACPCAVADRFLVVAEGAEARWRQSADVVTCLPRATAGCAREAAAAQVDRLPGLSLATVPVCGSGTLLHTRAERVLVRHEAGRAPVCGVCVYPWLVAGHLLTHLDGPLRRSARAGSPG
ncbi:hypothetical protein ACFRI7_09710 [Streptomyces sp. NPDC056716]|uniref:hypothetical protein n=1 Tax=unclassified Streptomyces TaxID=2593676 RepID=UPI00368EFE8C